MIYVGIEMGGLFTLGLHSNKLVACGDIFYILRPSLLIIFIFMQMHFIFLNQKMNVFKRKFASRVGLMQLILTNVCVWLRALIAETLEEVYSPTTDRQTRESDNLTNSEMEVMG